MKRARAGLGVAPVQQRVVEHEQRDDAVVLGVGDGQRGQIVDTEVAPEPDDRG